MSDSTHSTHRLYDELQELLRCDNRVFNFIDSTALDGLWYWDLEAPEHEWMSDSFWQTLGYDPATKQHLASEWQSIINQDDLAVATENCLKHCEDPSHPYDQIVRYTHATGKTIWVRCRGMAIRDESGKPIRLLGTHTDVTALKEQELTRVQTEQEQKLAYKKQALVLEELERTASIGTWEIDLQTNEITWSPQTKRIHEVPQDYTPTITSGINFYKEGESRRVISEAVEQGIAHGTPWDLELELVTAKGRNIWVRALGKPHFEDNKCVRLFGVFQDISQQKQVEKALRDARQEAINNAVRLQLAHNSVGMGVFELDLTNGELHWDKWMYPLYGVSEAQFSGAYDAWERCVHPEDIEQAKALLVTAIAETSTFDTQFRIIRPDDGKVRHIKANAAIVTDDTGTPAKVIGVNYDITDKVNTMAVLRQAKQKAESAAQAKSDFLANMSHEIRTPMNAILGGIQLLRSANLNEPHKTIINNAAFSAQSLLTIINDILDYSKIESNKLTLEKAPFSLKDVINSITYELDALVSNKGIKLITAIEKNVEDGWIGDVVRVKQVLLNIVSNAVKFTSEGEVRVHIHCEQYQTKQALFIEVTDTGIGMSEAMCQRIFERFTQADTSTTRKFGGTGLGMSITQSLVNLMGGELRLNSTEGKGTTVNVILPLTPTPLDETGTPVRTLSTPQLAGVRVLVAEDNAINQAVIEAFLNETNADITLVENGIEAVDTVKREDFDIILMDIHMPEMDGRQAQQHIAQLKKHIPIVALTANVMPDDVAGYIKQGFVSHIGKPIEVTTLYSVLRQYTGRG